MKVNRFFLSIIVSICISTFSTKAQTRIGIEYKPFYFNAEGTNPKISYYNFALLLKQKIDSTKFICVKPGLSIFDEGERYAGLDISITGQYMFNRPAYFYTGLKLHNNSADGGMSIKPNKRLITFIIFGLGFDITKFLEVEAGLQIPIINKSYAYNIFASPGSREYDIDYIFDFGFNIGFEL